MTRDELINEPADATAPEWARWKAQDSDGEWYWFIEKPRLTESIWFTAARYCLACKGKIPAGHDWRKTLKEVNVNRELNPNTSSVTDSQARAMAVESGTCSDGTQCGTFAETAYCDDCPNRPPMQYDPADVAFKPVDAHYKRYYKGVLLDPYRISAVYNMQGGPREQIMKKCLRFTDKGQSEQQVVDEIRSALNRWQAMLDEDAAS